MQVVRYVVRIKLLYLPLFLGALLTHRVKGQPVDTTTVLTTQPARGNATRLTGQVSSSIGTPVVGALASLLRTDSTLLKAAVTDSTGEFVFPPFPDGSYLIRVTNVGFDPAWQAFVLANNVAFPTVKLVLNPQTIKLAEVLVKQKRPAFEVLGDRIILHVEQNPLFSGGSTLDALRAAPRLSVDPITQSVSIDGKTGMILYQNGRQLYLTPEQIKAHLQNLPINAVSRIEVLTNPSARYDAAGGGVILLYTRRSADEGAHAEIALTGGFGRYPKANASVAGSLRQGSFLSTLLYTPNYRPTYSQYQSQQRLASRVPEQAGYSRADEFSRDDFRSHTMRIGIDWQVNTRLTVGTVWQGSQAQEINRPRSTIDYLPPGPASEWRQLRAASSYTKNIRNFTGNVNFRRQLGQRKHTLSGDLDVGQYVDRYRSAAAYTLVSPSLGATESVAVFYPNQTRLQTAKVDYVGSLGKESRFESGVKYSLVRMNNVPQAEEYTPGFESLLGLVVRSYRYREATTSAYSTFGYDSPKWSLQAGLRVEDTYYQGTSGDSLAVQRHYTNVFPSVSFQYTTTRKGQFSASANRRIVRPAFDLLNPAYVFYDPITLYSGNPLLLPQFSTTLQTTYTSSRRLSLTFVYTQNQNRIVQVLYRQDSLSPTITNTTINFDRDYRLALTASLPLQLTKGWQVQTTVTGARLDFFSNFGDQPTFRGQTVISGRLLSTVSGKQWSANASVFYRSGTVLGFLQYKPIWYVDAGFQRTLSQRATVKLSATDIFHSLRVTNYGQYLKTDVSFRHRYESQQFLATYAYRLGSNKPKTVKSRTFGSEAEQERLRRDP